MIAPKGFKQVGVLFDGKLTDARALYYIEEQTTLVSAADLGKLLNIPVQGLGDKINIGKVVVPPPKPLIGKKIAISAPHSRNANRSPVNPAYYEGNVMFYVATELANMLKAQGANILLVRDTLDTKLTLDQRSDMINKWRAELVLELHSDASGTSTLRGIHCIRSIINKSAMPHLLIDEIHKSTGLPIRSYPGLSPIWTKVLPNNTRFDWFHMIREIQAPVFLLENGYHTNPQDVAFLASPAAPKLIATGATNAVLKYYKAA